ncbi:hypothetical protein LCGC14_0388690 [marine sediment metagenome]|uniref:Uncharacterized protein n=1 Tax=marine sediment metagenome TaxID=412755 RepID=A0A0F9TIE3_9ZZZZ
MEALKLGEIRVHLKGGTSYICPELNKANVVRSIGGSVARIEHYKPLPAATLPAAPPTPPKPEGKTKESLLGGLLQDNKITAPEFIKWIEASKSIEDLAIVMKGETRKTVKAAYKKRLNELA